MQLVRNAQCPCCESRESETIQHTLFECPAFAKERDTFLERLYELHPIARGLSPEGHCAFLMGDVLPRETGAGPRFAGDLYRYVPTDGSARVCGVGDCTRLVPTLGDPRETSGPRIDRIPPARPPWRVGQYRELKKIFFFAPQ